MIRELYHPNAHLVAFRNVKPGLKARTGILNALETVSASAKTISEQTNLRYGAVMHHLRLLESRVIVRREGSRPFLWVLTGSGQRRLR